MRAEKQFLLDEIEEKLEGANAFVLASYKKMTPDASHEFRAKLRESGGGFSIVPKRILRKAAKAGGIDLAEQALDGHIGVIFAEDEPVAPTKAVFDFSKSNGQVLEVIGGYYEGKLCSAEEMKALSKLPTKDEMRAQFLGLLEAPAAQTLSVMDALLTSLLHCLENKSQQD